MCTVWLSHSKWLSEWRNASVSNFALSLNIPPWKLLFMWFRRLHLWATSDWHLHHDNAPAHVSYLAEVFGETSNHPDDLAPLQPRFGALHLLDLPKTKIAFKDQRFQTIHEIQENTTGQLMTIGRTVWGPKVPTLNGTEAALSYVQCFLYLLSSSINVSIFYIMWLNTIWKELIQYAKLVVWIKEVLIRYI